MIQGTGHLGEFWGSLKSRGGGLFPDKEEIPEQRTEEEKGIYPRAQPRLPSQVSGEVGGWAFTPRTDLIPF